ncbi:MAG TPA: GNAT family N-acetyltransferase [Bacteroidales bacterium]|nr:GNAT family N-acetyltransferase [Bacteroidales bacterium]
MKPIIPPISVEDLKKELTPDKLIRTTNFGNNEIYIVTHKNAPNVMLEIGRLRELTFRAAGGGSGKSIDIDKFDTAEDTLAYRQIVLWNPHEEEIIGGYRFLLMKNLLIDKTTSINSAFSELFKITNTFIEDYLPYCIELGRSFIQPAYQSSKYSRKSMYALDNLWDGLGALIVLYPEMKYFLGKITMYGDYNYLARDLILYFFKKYFYDDKNLIYPYDPIKINTDISYLSSIINKSNYVNNYHALNKKVRELGENIPPLFNSYMNISSTMKVFGTAINPFFGNVEETAIIITIADIYEKKKSRHIQSYLEYLKNAKKG